MYKIYVGTKNQVKLNACEEVFSEFEVVGYNSNSKVGVQPSSDEETINGAINRALDIPYKGIRIGLEAGVQETLGILYLINWGVLIDEEGNIYYAGGTRIPLPKVVKEKLETEDTELAIVMDEYYQTVDIKHNEGAIGFFTSNQVKRVDIFVHICKLLYGQYLSKNIVIK